MNKIYRFPLRINTFSHLLIISLLFFLQIENSCLANAFSFHEDDFNIGGDIFSDFSEEVEASQVMEDERFYRYGRFFTFNIGLGLTTYTGNRGQAYESSTPSYAVSLSYFTSFQTSIGFGFEYSQHSMFIPERTQEFFTEPLGAIDINMFRTHFFMRYYLDTSNLGTAITYSNPYAVGRLEYWYQTNNFIDQFTVANRSGGAFGSAFGLGFEFPVEIKKTYINVEFLYHQVNFFDRDAKAYRPIPGVGVGYEDLRGDVFTVFVNYVVNW